MYQPSPSIRSHKEERKMQKELIKALETPEQKRQRRLEKKEEKERIRKRMMGWDEEYIGYTNEDNPFGDSNLHETFVWKKKYEKLGMKHINEEEIDQINKQKMLKNRQELEKVKKRRLEREHERELRMQELAKMQRDKEADQFKEWSRQEDFFHLKQAKLRSKLRIKEGRAKCIDILARYINVFGENEPEIESKNETNNDDSNLLKKQEAKQDEEDDLLDKIKYLSGYLNEPYNNLNGLRIRDMEDLVEDIKIYLELDSGTKVNAEYWKDLLIIVDDELTKLKLANMDLNERRREGINPSVSADIAKILNGKTPQQLKSLQMQIEKKITTSEEGIDIGYWETLLSRLKAQIARARLREFHEGNVKIQQLLLDKYIKELQPVTNIFENNNQECVAPNNYDNNTEAEETELLSQNEIRQKCIEDYISGNYSPIHSPNNDLKLTIISLEEFESDLKKQRLNMLQKLDTCSLPFIAVDKEDDLKKKSLNFDNNSNKLTPAEKSFVLEASKGMDDDEAVFSVEEELIDDNAIKKRKQEFPLGKWNTINTQILIKDKYSWAEKYRPRKPRYFNRVHTGFEWNKYNQTHYDVDNPPPKVVQGYKFNIFYPDLINKTNTPTYKITPCPDNTDFAYIRFSAGPPYEDICFKIVNREWNYSYKSGFRCQFQNNILQLWFHFKRYRYRR